MSLTKQECENVLSETKIYLKNQMQKKERISHSVYLLNTITYLFEKLIHEYFDNPPLKWEELEPDMWIWDKKFNQWIQIDETWSSYKKFINGWIVGSDLLQTIEFEPDRFYRKEVQE